MSVKKQGHCLPLLVKIVFSRNHQTSKREDNTYQDCTEQGRTFQFIRVWCSNITSGQGAYHGKRRPADIFKTSWESVYRAVQHVVEYGLANRNFDGITEIGSGWD